MICINTISQSSCIAYEGRQYCQYLSMGGLQYRVVYMSIIGWLGMCHVLLVTCPATCQGTWKNKAGLGWSNLFYFCGWLAGMQLWIRKDNVIQWCLTPYHIYYGSRASALMTLFVHCSNLRCFLRFQLDFGLLYPQFEFDFVSCFG